RDRNVTGVQTCALPILSGDQCFTSRLKCRAALAGFAAAQSSWGLVGGLDFWPAPRVRRLGGVDRGAEERAEHGVLSAKHFVVFRSEERRVGKVCGAIGV